MKHAFIHKNFRNLSFEKKTIFLSHLLTLVFCFFPWFYATDSYDGPFWYSAFGGPSFLIGFLIFLISFVIVILFIDRLLEKETVKLPFSENTLYFAAGAQQILLIILAWSVLSSKGTEFADYEIRFGIFLVFVAQVSGLVATFLNAQLEAQHKARNFFNGSDDHQDPPTLIAKK